MNRRNPFALAAALLVSLPVTAPAQAPAPPPEGERLRFADEDALCKGMIFIDRLGPGPNIEVTPDLLLTTLRSDRSPACRWRAAMLLGYFGTGDTPRDLMTFATQGLKGAVEGAQQSIVLGALHGLGIYVRTHPDAPLRGEAIDFLVDAASPEFWEGGHVTWSMPGATPETFAQDTARSVLIGLGLTGTERAWRELDTIARDHRQPDAVSGRAVFALGLLAEARASMDPR
jgi:hypothetical protein